MTQDLWAAAERRPSAAASSAICAPGGTSTATRSRRTIAERIEAHAAGGQAGHRRPPSSSRPSREGDRALVRFRPRGSDAVESLRVARIVNCTGPEADIVRSGEPLLAALLERRPDPARSAAASASTSTAICRAIDADGKASDSLYAIGPVTRGTFWESVAVPDIQQVAGRADRRR